MFSLNLIISRCFAEDGKETDVPKFETLVQSDCFCLSETFAALLLPSQSSLLVNAPSKSGKKDTVIAFMERWSLVFNDVSPSTSYKPLEYCTFPSTPQNLLYGGTSI